MKPKILGVFLLAGLFSCSDADGDFDLKGKWIDTESPALQFIEFYSKNEGRFGLYSKDYERYENFTYRLFDNKIAIDFIGDSEGETVHKLTSVDQDKIRISGLTVNPEGPEKTFQRFNLKTEKQNNEVVLGTDDVFFDFETGIRLRGYTINDSRCPDGATCFWAGYAAARFNLIVDGNTEHTFDLATVDLPPSLPPTLKTDTLISGTTYRLTLLLTRVC